MRFHKQATINWYINLTRDLFTKLFVLKFRKERIRGIVEILLNALPCEKGVKNSNIS